MASYRLEMDGELVGLVKSSTLKGAERQAEVLGWKVITLGGDDAHPVLEVEDACVAEEREMRAEARERKAAGH